MAASESTKFQINYRLADGTLVNIYATNQAELEASLTSIADVSTLITSTGTALGATAQSTAGAARLNGISLRRRTERSLERLDVCCT